MSNPPEQSLLSAAYYNVESDERAFELARDATTPDDARFGLTAALLRENPIPLLERLEEAGTLNRWLPELMECRGVSQLPDHPIDALTHSYQAAAGAPPTVLSRWTALLHDAGKARTRIISPKGRTRFFGHEKLGAELAWPMLLRLGFPPDFVDSVACLINLHLRPLAYGPEWTDSAVRRLVDEAGPLWLPLLAQCRADLLGYAPEKVESGFVRLDQVTARAEGLNRPAPHTPASPLNGDELMAIFKREPGSWLREVKGALDSEVRAKRLREGDKARAEQIARAILARLDAQ